VTPAVAAEALARHGFPAVEPVAGFNPTHPTFVCGDVVVKVFAGTPRWRFAFEAERAALALVNGAVPAPRLLADGWIEDRPYVVMSRVEGTYAEDLGDRSALAAEVGEIVRRLHALPADGVVTVAEWDPVGITDAARRSSLPPHLAAQAEAFVASVPVEEPVVCHADLCAMHVFVAGGHLSAVIDWGDTVAADPHYELIQVYRDLLACDGDAFRVFLDAAAWPAYDDLPRRALAGGIRRQALGLVQHRTIDVFMPIAERFPLGEIATLDDLAETLFA